MANRIIKCKNCGSEISPGSKFCKQCGAKRKSNKGLIIGIVIGLIFIAMIGGAVSGGDDADTSATNNEYKQTTADNDDKSSNDIKEIEYIQISVDDLNNALDNNPINASDTYKGQYVEITGRLAVIDASGDYIGVYALHDDWDFTGVHCSIEEDAQLEIIKTMSIDDTITVRGKITSVGELLGYSLDIIEIVQ